MGQPDNQPGPGQNQNDPGTGGGQNPAWDEILGFIPEESKAAASEKLRAWDSGVQQKITQLHSEYEPYKPFISQYGPEDLQTAIGIAQALQADPQQFWNQMAETYGFDPGQGPGNQNPNPNPGGQPPGSQQVPPEFQQMFEERYGKVEQALGVIAQQLQSFQTERQQELQVQQLQSLLNQLGQTHGEFDMDYVLAKIGAGVSPEDAVKQYHEIAGTAKRQEANNGVPTILGSGGGLPTNQIDPSKLDRKGMESTVAALLERANQQ